MQGKHRIHRQLANGATSISCRVLQLSDVKPCVVGVPLCLLPPLPADLNAAPEEDDIRGSSATGAKRYLRRLGVPVVEQL